MKKGKKRYTKKSVYKNACVTVTLIILVVALSYGIMQTDWLSPRINELSASYISLNNTDTTDMLKVTNLRKLSDKKGIGSRNKSLKEFQVTGETDYKYKIVLYHIGDMIDEENVKFFLENEMDVSKEGILKNQEETYDGGRVIYEGTIKEGQNWRLKMWVDKGYQGSSNNVSYEIRIKAS